MAAQHRRAWRRDDVPPGISGLKAVAIDVDGTLLNPAHCISPAVGKAIRHAWRHGIRIILASGRHPGSLCGLLAQLGIDGHVVAFSGGVVARAESGGRIEILFQKQLDLGYAESLAQQALGDGLSVAWSTLDGWYTPGAGEMYRQEAAILQQKPVIVPGLKGVGIAPHKLQIMSGNAADMLRLRALRAEILPMCSAVFSHDYMLEVMPRGTDKADGLACIGRLQDLEIGEMMAIGDAENDMEMLRRAGWGVAMGHAPEAIKAAADWVTLTNGEDGVAFALEQGWFRRYFSGKPPLHREDHP